MKSLIAILAALFITCNTHAMTQIEGITEGTDLVTSYAVQKIVKSTTPYGLYVGFKSMPIIYEGNSVDYTLIGILGYPFAATLEGTNHASNYRSVIGVQGSVYKASKADAIGLKCSIYDNLPGGTSTCLTISFPYPQEGTHTAGVIMEGSTWATGLIGFEVENPQSYKYSFDFNNSKLAMGSKDNVVYCLQFNQVTAEMNYIKNCGTSSEKIIGQVAISTAPTVSKYTKPKR